MHDVVKRVVENMGLGLDVDYSDDVQKIVQMGLMQSPVLAVNGKPVLIGFTPDTEKIKKAIESNLA